MMTIVRVSSRIGPHDTKTALMMVRLEQVMICPVRVVLIRTSRSSARSRKRVAISGLGGFVKVVKEGSSSPVLLFSLLTALDSTLGS